MLKKVSTVVLATLIVMLLLSAPTMRSARAFGSPYVTDRSAMDLVQGGSDFAAVNRNLIPEYVQDRYFDERAERESSSTLVVGVDSTQPTTCDELISFVAANGGTVLDTVSMGGKVTAVVVKFRHENSTVVKGKLERTQLSRFVEPQVKFHTSFVPNDLYWLEEWQWGSVMIEADWAWNTTIGDPSVLVAVVDTGVDYRHMDLVGNYVPYGYDWVNNDPDPLDDHGHGTHCAGIIAAVINNSIGIAGTAQVRIMAEKGFPASGSGSSSDLANCIIHAVDRGADIISMSWGGFEASQLLHDAITYAYNAGVLLVAAVGNDRWSIKQYPAAYPEVIAVTATDQYDAPADFTNFGNWVELAAPGVAILSTFPGNRYAFLQGTSMAAPYVSGVGALIWSQFPAITRNQVRSQLRR
ncbi:MAG: peptidase S8, partial [Candidatus Bathyarchaeota archaeon]